MARNDEYISIGMGLDIADLKAGLQDAKSQLKLAESEFKKNTSALDDWGNSAEGVLEQIVLLNEKIAYQEKQMGYTRSEIERAAEKYGAASTKVKDLTAKLNDQEAYLNKLKGQMDTAKGKLDTFASSESLAGRSAKELADSVDRLRQRLSEQEVVAGNLRIELDKVVQQYGEGSVQARNLSDQIRVQDEKLRDIRSVLMSYESALDQAGDEAEDTATSVDHMNDEMENTGSATRSLTDAVIPDLQTKLQDLARNGIMKVVGALKDFIEQSIKLGIDFTSTMSEVRASSGASAEEMQVLTQTAREFGKSSVFSATEAAQALNFMALASWSVQDSVDGLGGVLDLAAASGMELKDASDLVTDYLGVFGLSAAESARMADVLAYAQSNANTTVAQLGEAFRNSASMLAPYGTSMEELVALLAMLANNGLKGSEAGTALSAVMRDITNKMQDGAIKIGSASVKVKDSEGNLRGMTDILRDIGTALDGLATGDRATALSDTFTAHSLRGINLLLLAGADNVSQFTEELQGSSGAAKEMAEIMNDNLGGDLKKFNSLLEDLKLALFDLMEGPLRAIVQALNTLLENSDGIGQGVADNLGPMFDKFAAAAKGVDALKSADWDGIAAKASSAWEGVKSAFSDPERFFKGVGESITGGLKRSIGDIQGWFGNTFAGAWERAKGAFGGAYEWASKVWTDIRGAFASASGWFGNLFTGAWENIKAAFRDPGLFFKEVWEKIKAPFQPVIKFFSDLFGGDTVSGGAVGAIKRPFESIGNFFSGVWESIKRPFSGVVEFFRNLFGGSGGGGAAEAMTKPFDGIGQRFQQIWNSIKAPFNNVIGFFEDLFGGGNHGDSVADVIMRPFNGIKTFFQGVYDQITAPFKNIQGWFAKLFGGTTDGRGDDERTAGAVGAIKSPFEGLGAFFTTVKQSILSPFGTVIDTFSGLFGRAAQAVKNAFDGVARWFDENVLTPLRRGVEEAIGEASNLGGGMVQGVVDSKRDMVAGTTTIGEIITNSLLDYFGIHSPSRLMRDKVGMMIGLGIVEGMKDTELAGVQEAARWSQRLSDGLTLSVDAEALSGSAPAAQPVQNVVTYNQVINSPEPLSAGEIYRDTRSLIGRRLSA